MSRPLVGFSWTLPSLNSNQHPYSPSSAGSRFVHRVHDALETEEDLSRSLIDTLDPNARPKAFRNLVEECLFVFMVMMATASTTFVQGVVVINTATIGRDLSMSPAQITWISAAIGLASGSFMLFFGKTADIIGRKPQLLSGMALLSITSLGTAFVASPIAMNVLCGVLGLGTAIVSPPAIGTLFATYPEGRRRNEAAGALGTGNPIGFILGSFSSGIATKYFSWRASFIVIAVFFAIMTVSTIWTMPSIPRTDSFRAEARQFDYLGTILTIVGLALVSAALTEGPELGWASVQFLVMLLFGLSCLIGFGFWENIYPFPLLSPSVWNIKTYTLCVLCVFFGYMSFITNLFWISLYMQDVQHLSPLDIAIRLLPQALVGFLWSYVGQALVSRIPGRTIMGIGGAAYLVGAILQFFVRPGTSYWFPLFPSLCITVIGADFQFIVSNLYINQQMPSQSSLAAGVLQTAMRLSISVGLVITAAVYGSASTSSAGRANPILPFERAYLCSIMFAVASLLLVPFMEIGKQGGKSKAASIIMVEKKRPRSATEYRDEETAEPDRRIGGKRSQSSLWSSATFGSVGSVFPRWSWEAELAWPDDRYRPESRKVVCEVCVRCLAERKVVVLNDSDKRQSLDPNPFRRISENMYEEPHVDGTRGPYGANFTRAGVWSASLGSAETLRGHEHDLGHSRRMHSRTPLGGDSSHSSVLRQFPRPPTRDVMMTGARTTAVNARDLTSREARDEYDCVSLL